MISIAFEKFIARIEATGTTREEAERYAALIGDDPLIIGTEVAVCDAHGKEVTRLPKEILDF